VADYRCCIEQHLLPVFGDCMVEEIDRARCLRFKARLVGDARQLREAIGPGRICGMSGGAGAYRSGRPPSARCCKRSRQFLEDAVEDELIETNPARGKRAGAWPKIAAGRASGG
jgi:hypothetical protein